MKRLHSLACALLLTAINSYAEVVNAGGGGLVWSMRCDGYMVQVPDGWFLDNKIAAREGIDMFFLPNGAPRILSNKMPVYAYVMPTAKPPGAAQQAGVQGLINSAFQDYKRADASSTFTVSANAWELDAKERKVTLAHISAPALGKFDAIAYDENEQAIFAVTLTANSAKLLAEKEGFLKQIVSSAKFIRSNASKPPCPPLPALN